MTEYSYNNRFDYLRDNYLPRISKKVEDDQWFEFDGDCVDTRTLLYRIFWAEKTLICKTDIYHFIKLHFPKTLVEIDNDPTYDYEDEPEPEDIDPDSLYY